MKPICRWVCVFIAVVSLGLWTGYAGAADLQSKLNALVSGADLRQTKISVLIFDLKTGKKLGQINPDEPMAPASNMKLLTTAAAAKMLGPDFTFRTELRLVEPGDWPTQQNAPDHSASAPAKGHVLVIHGDGDPGLADPELLTAHNMDVEQFLQQWVKAVQDAKIDHVERLIVDDRIFAREFVHPSWPAEQLSAWYCAQVAGISFYDNCIDVYAEPTSRGQGARVRLMPAAPFMETTNRAMTGNFDNFKVNRKTGTNELIFTGEVKTRRTQGVNVTINDPPQFFAEVLRDRLVAAGIKVDHIARPDMDEVLPGGKAILVVEDSLPLILQRCNKDSQNLFAECLFKRMGRVYTGAPGSWDNGAAAIRQFLHDTLGVQAASITIKDGSGMSHENRVTASVMVGLLTAMRADAKLWTVYRDSLSMDHSDGSLKRRFRELAPDIKGQLFPKTGYINNVCTLSGYVLAPKSEGDEGVAFSLLFNNFQVPLGQIQGLQDNIIRMIDRYEVAQAAGQN